MTKNFNDVKDGLVRHPIIFQIEALNPIVVL